jgi:hypothetical protein
MTVPQPSHPKPLLPAFLAANAYLGWGEPHRGVWFVGLEEADGWFDLPADEIVRRYRALGEVSPATTQRDFAALGPAGRSIRHTTSRILSAVSERAQAEPASERWRWYHDHQLWAAGSMTFQANLYPLGKPSRGSWPATFEDLFGFGPDDRERYRQAVAETRWPRLRARRDEDHPAATICFGGEAWADFRTIFRVTSTPRQLAEGKIHVHDAERVILTYFFSYGHVTNSDADAIGALLRDDWKVRVP